MARPQRDYSHLSDGAYKILEQIHAGQVRIPLKRGSRLIKTDAEARAVIEKISKLPPGQSNNEL